MAGATRKRHVRVDPEKYVYVLDEVAAARLDDIAEHLSVSEATARRRLDGLVAQGRIRLLHERPREYGRLDEGGS
jgi:predicted ArsR family transcriptional regulator